MKSAKQIVNPSYFAVKFGDGGTSTTSVDSGHYDRMMAVIDAAKSGNQILIKFALENYDVGGSGP